MPRVRFGSHEFNSGTGALSRGRDRCDLQSQPAQLLALLVAHAGDIVTREQIRLTLWPETIVSYDQNINFAIRQIRVALGADASLVQTVPRHGYRFVGGIVRETWQDGGIAGLQGQPGFLNRGRSWRGAAAAAAIALALVSGFGAGLLVRDAPAGRFVYDHLVHPDRCPYLRILLPNHGNS